MDMRTIQVNGAPAISAAEKLRRHNEEGARIAALAAKEAEEQRIADARTAAIREAARKREHDEADAAARKRVVMEQASSLMLPEVVTTAHPKNYNGIPLLDIKHIESQYDAVIVGAAPAYRLTNDGQLIASDNVILQNTWRIESQLMPESHTARAVSLYAAWLSNRVDTLAAKAAAIASHREISGACVLYVAKLPTVRVVKDSEYKELSRIVCEWGDFCVMGMGE